MNKIKNNLFCLGIICLFLGCSGKLMTLNDELAAFIENSSIKGSVIVVDKTIEDQISISNFQAMQTSSNIKIQIKISNLKKNIIYTDYKVRLYSNGLKIDNNSEYWIPVSIDRNDSYIIDFIMPAKAYFFELLLKEGGKK